MREDEGVVAFLAHSLDGLVDFLLDGSHELFLKACEVLACGVAELLHLLVALLKLVEATLLDGVGSGGVFLEVLVLGEELVHFLAELGELVFVFLGSFGHLGLCGSRLRHCLEYGFDVDYAEFLCESREGKRHDSGENEFLDHFLYLGLIVSEIKLFWLCRGKDKEFIWNNLNGPALRC